MAVVVPSLTVYVKLPDVVSLPSCLYVTLLSSSDNATVPLTAPPTPVTLSVLPSGSLSLASSRCDSDLHLTTLRNRGRVVDNHGGRRRQASP